MSAPLLAVDAPSLLYRAFFALPQSITDGEGRPVNALLGTANLVLFAVERYAPRAVVLCWGAEAAAYRKQLYDPYHADRPPMPAELASQREDAPTFFGAFGWSHLDAGDLEADDLLGTLATLERDAGGTALILTGDRDLFQCATEQVTILLQRTGRSGPEPLGPAEVEERYGVSPAAVPDFIALRGDPSDGLPGAKGIGEKTAAELLRRHGTLEKTLDAAVQETPAIRRALIGQRDELIMFKDVATLRDAPVERPADTPTDFAGGSRIAEVLGLRRLAERLGKLAAA